MLTLTIKKDFLESPAFNRLLALDNAKLSDIVGQRMQLIQPIALHALQSVISQMGLIGLTHRLYDQAYVTPFTDNQSFPLFMEFGDTAPYAKAVFLGARGKSGRNPLQPAMQQFMPIMLSEVRSAIQDYLSGQSGGH